MSDREHSVTPRSASGSLVSHSKSRSRTPSAHSGRSRSPTRSRTRSRTSKRSYSRSRSRSHSKRYRNRKRHSRSRSRSPRRSRSRGGRYHRSHSRSPLSNRRRHVGNRENPPTSRCVGVFGLSLYTQDKDLRDVFSKYGPVDQVQIVYDHHTGRSRGFAFVYFERGEDARVAKERCNGIEVDGRRIRVDFSITQRAHTPTPGVYMGKPTGRYRRSPSPYRRGGRYSRSRSRSYSRSPLPRIEERIKKG